MKCIYWMVRLYPQGWRERYEDEFGEVLEQHQAILATWVDVFFHVLDAHLHPLSWSEGRFLSMNPSRRLSRSVGIIMAAFLAMLLSYVIFLSNLGDIFDWTIRHQLFTDFLNRHLSSLMDLQLLVLLLALLLVTGAVAFQKEAVSAKYWKFIPLILVLFPTVNASFYFACRYFPGAVCRLDWGWGNLTFLPLILVVPLTAIVLFKRHLKVRLLKITWLALAIIVLGMLVEVAETVTWGILVWGTSQGEVTYLAQAYDRSLFPGDYHIWLTIGLGLVLVFAAAAIAALVYGLPAWWKKARV